MILTIWSWLLSCANHNVWILVLKLTLVVELWVLLSSHWLPLLKCPALTVVDGTALRNAHRDSDCTAMTAIMYWRLCAKTHPDGEVVSTVVIFVSFLPPLLSSMVVMCRALAGTRCRLATYVIWAAFERRLNTSWWMKTELPRYPWYQSRTCYLEWGCHL